MSKNKKDTYIAIPRPTLLIKGESIYSDTQGCNFGKKISVKINATIHFKKDRKLNEKPFIEH